MDFLRPDLLEHQHLSKVKDVEVKAGNTESLRKRRFYSSFESGAHTDFTVRDRDGIEWKVHKVIVTRDCEFFSNALKGDFKESQTNVIEMPNDDPAAVKALLEFLYVEDYSITDDTPANFSSIRLHLEAYIAGEIYGVPGLKDLAYQRFVRLWFTSPCPCEDVSRVVRRIYESTPESDRKIRDFMADVSSVHLLGLLRDKDFIQVMADFEDFGASISKVMRDTILKQKACRFACRSCRGIAPKSTK